MNIKQAKGKFSIRSLLALLGHRPDARKSKGNDLWYISPFRPGESDPSFHIDTRNDFYKDFGDTEKGGDLIWFAQMYLKHCGRGHSVSDALTWFEELNGGSNLHIFNKQAKKKPRPQEVQSSEEPYKILSDKEIFSSVLFDYLNRKRLSIPIAKRYLRQVYFLNRKTKSKMFGLGFKTRAGGFDIRTANGFKTMIGGKNITIIEGSESANIIDIYEGASDFLTTLSVENLINPKFDTIVLNSANLYKMATDYIKANSYSHIRTWFDNDNAGYAFEEAFIKELKEGHYSFKITRMNQIYEGFKDLNDWHVSANLSLSRKKNLLLEVSNSKSLSSDSHKLRA